ncbi:hypothetical protein B7P43_G00358, partial [Cryptotermes secundus]
AGLLSTYTGNGPHHVRNSMEFVHTLGSLHADPHDIMASFDVVSLFTRVPIKDTMDLLGRRRVVFRQNGYNNRQIHRVLNRRPNISRPEDKPGSVAFLPYVGTIFNRISRVLSRHNIKAVGLPPNKLSSLLRLFKDSLGLRTPGVYSI